MPYWFWATYSFAVVDKSQCSVFMLFVTWKNPQYWSINSEDCTNPVGNPARGHLIRKLCISVIVFVEKEDLFLYCPQSSCNLAYAEIKRRNISTTQHFISAWLQRECCQWSRMQLGHLSKLCQITNNLYLL